MDSTIITKRLKKCLRSHHGIDYALYSEYLFNQDERFIKEVVHSSFFKKKNNKFADLSGIVLLSQIQIDEIIKFDIFYKDEIKKMAFIEQFNKSLSKCKANDYFHRDPTVKLFFIIIPPYRKYLFFKTELKVLTRVIDETISKEKPIIYNNFYEYIAKTLEKHDMMITAEILKQMSFDDVVNLTKEIEEVIKMSEY